MKEKVLKNTVYCGLSTFVTGLIGLLLLPFMVRQVGKVEYGLVGIVSIFAMSGYVSLLEMGFQAAIARYVARYYEREQYQKISHLVTSTLALFFGIGVGLALIGIMLAGIIQRDVFAVPQMYQDSFRYALWFVFISYLFQFPCIVYAGLLEGLQRFDMLKGGELATTLLQAVGIVVLLLKGVGYLAIVGCTLGCLLLRFAIYAYWSHRILPCPALRRSQLSLDAIREVWSMTKFLSIGKVASLIYHSTPRVIVGAFMGPVAMTSFEMIVRLPRFIKTGLGFLNAAVMPAASTLQARGDERALQALYIRGLKYQLVIVVPLLSGLLFLAGPFLVSWAGSDFSELTGLLRLMFLWNCVYPFFSYGASILLGMNRRVKELTAFSVACAALSIVVSLVFVKRAGLWAVVGGYVIGLVGLFPIPLTLALRELDIRGRKVLTEFLGIAKFAVVPLVIVWGINQLWDRQALAVVIVKLAIWCLCYWALLFWLVLRPEERTMLRGLWGRRAKATPAVVCGRRSL